MREFELSFTFHSFYCTAQFLRIFVSMDGWLSLLPRKKLEGNEPLGTITTDNHEQYLLYIHNCCTSLHRFSCRGSFRCDGFYTGGTLKIGKWSAALVRHLFRHHYSLFPNFNRHFASGTNAVWPRPSWPANGDIPESKIAPLSETEPGAMDFKLWKLIGH